MATELTKRKVFYYDLRYTLPKGNVLGYQEIFSKIIDLNNNLERSRIKEDPYGLILTNDVKINSSQKMVFGKLLRVRTDIFPQLINMTNDQIKDLSATSEEGVVETSHFIIDVSNLKTSKLAIEYNHFGPRFGHLYEYIRRAGLDYGIINGMSFDLIVQNRLEQMANRINRCSSISVKVHEQNIPDVYTQNNGLGSALSAAQKIANSDKVELILKFDYKEKSSTKAANGLLASLLKVFAKDSSKLEAYDRFQVMAEDEMKNNNLELFDLLTDKEMSILNVAKRSNSRTIVSTDIFEKMKHEFRNKFG